MHVSLPMYDLPEAQAATDRWWRRLARALREEGLDGVPERLDRSLSHHRCWERPDLLFSQSCGYPAMTAYRDRLRIVATPVYRAPGCEGAHYASVILVRAGDEAASLAALRGRRCAVNAFDSQSGCNALRRAIAPIAGGAPFFSAVVESGGHEASIAAVTDRRADVCAVDCVTYAMLGRYRAWRLAGVRAIGETPAAPGLPFVTGAGRSESEVRTLRAGLARAFADPDSAALREALFLAGVEVLAGEAYHAVLDMESEARALGYPALA